jgi:carbon-monoxide dehydrogenase small subunit
MQKNIRFILNGQPVSVTTEPDRILLWVLRTDLGLTGTKYGCGESLCGSCTVLLENQAVRSCQMTVGDVQGKQVTTIEGLADEETLHPVQQAFVENDAMQCGFCTPGMIMNAVGLLAEKPHPSEAEIVEGMSGNLCRCGGYNRIVKAVSDASGSINNGREKK